MISLPKLKADVISWCGVCICIL